MAWIHRLPHSPSLLFSDVLGYHSFYVFKFFVPIFCLMYHLFSICTFIQCTFNGLTRSSLEGMSICFAQKIYCVALLSINCRPPFLEEVCRNQISLAGATVYIRNGKGNKSGVET